MILWKAKPQDQLIPKERAKLEKDTTYGKLYRLMMEGGGAYTTRQARDMLMAKHPEVAKKQALNAFQFLYINEYIVES